MRIIKQLMGKFFHECHKVANYYFDVRWNSLVHHYLARNAIPIKYILFLVRFHLTPTGLHVCRNLGKLLRPQRGRMSCCSNCGK